MAGRTPCHRHRATSHCGRGTVLAGQERVDLLENAGCVSAPRLFRRNIATAPLLLGIARTNPRTTSIAAQPRSALSHSNDDSGRLPTVRPPA